MANFKKGQNKESTLEFYGGIWTAIIPFVIFISGVIYIALSGAPDERGFWPILILALGISLILAKDKKKFSETVINGMSESIVMIMITAWILASIIGVLMTETGFVEGLTWLAGKIELQGVGFVLITFIICCLVSLSTGSSFATILICSPILYPSGGLVGAHLPTLAGAIIGGATFGDFFAPISDTTIASALSQKAEIGPTVRSRLKYILPAFLIALILYSISAYIFSTVEPTTINEVVGDPKGLPMILVPIYIIYLFLKGKHLLHGLLLGLLFGLALALILNLLNFSDLISIDLNNMVASSLIIDGVNRAVGISFFTILLMGLVSTIKSAGLIDRFVAFANKRTNSKSGGERWISFAISSSVLLITHSVVAILMISEFVNSTGKKLSINPIRRANLLSLVACVFPFILPYFIPVILMANTTNSGSDFGISSISPFQVGLYNYLSWTLLLLTILSVFLGYGRKGDSKIFKTMQKNQTND